LCYSAHCKLGLAIAIVQTANLFFQTEFSPRGLLHGCFR